MKKVILIAVFALGAGFLTRADVIESTGQQDCSSQGGDWHYNSTHDCSTCCTKGDKFQWIIDPNGDVEGCCGSDCQPADPG